MTAARTVTYKFVGDFRSLSAGLAATGRSVGDLGTKMTALDKNGAKTRAGLTQMGDTAAKVGLVAAAGLGAAVVASANFEKAMSDVQAATGETAANMDRLREAAITAGAETAFSASEAAGAIEALSKAGVSTADILGGGLTGALDLAAAGGLEVGAAAEYAATAMTQFGLAGSDVGHVADLMASAAGSAQGEVSDFGAALNQSGLVAAQMGLSIEETTGALAAFASAGLIGSDAGTSLKTGLLALANPSQEAADLMERLGINAYDASGNLVSLSDLAGQLQTAFDGQSQATRDAALATIFGSDAIRVANVLYSQGAEGIESWTENVDQAGAAAEMAAIKMDNLAGDWEEFTGSLETALIGTGSGSQGPLRDLVQGATAAVNVFNGMPGPIKDTTAAMLGITAVTGGGLWFGTKVVAGITATNEALAALGITSRVTAGSLATAAKSAGALAIVATAGFAAWDVTDTFLRSREAADATAESFAQLQQVLADSNVGKFADDLGFDLQQLAADLAVNGREGEYVGEVFKALADTAYNDTGAALRDIGTKWIPGFTSEAEKASSAVEDLDSILDNNADALGKGSTAAEEAAGAEGQLEAAVDEAAAAIAEETAALDENKKSMAEKRAATLAAFDAETAWGAAVTAAREAANKGKRGIDQMTEAGRENRAALSQLAGAWNELPKKAQAVEGRFQSARKTFIDTATAMGVGEDRARALANQMLEIPKKVNTDVTANTSQAQANIASLKRYLDGIDRHIDVFVNVVRRGVGAMNFGFADGGPIACLVPTGLPAALTQE